MTEKAVISLAQMSRGRDGIILKVSGGPGAIRRLENMGMRVGQRVTKVSGMPLRGPVVVQSGGTRIGLGHGMARKVIVEPVK